MTQTRSYVLFYFGLAVKFVGPFASTEDAKQFQKEEIVAARADALTAIVTRTGERWEESHYSAGMRGRNAVRAFRYGGDLVSSAEYRALRQAYPDRVPQA